MPASNPSAARAFQAMLRNAWYVAGPKSPKVIEQLSRDMEPLMRRCGRPIQVLADSTIHDNLYKDKARVSRWPFVYSLWVVLGEYMRQNGPDSF